MHPLLEKIAVLDRHAYLLSGPETVDLGGQARELVQRLFCETKTACGNCIPCRKISSHPDFIVLSPEKGSIKIGEIRGLLQKIQFRPLEAERKVVLLTEAERMTEGAANALLKTLEEPPPSTLFLLTTAVPERLPATIRSRCQKISLLGEAEIHGSRWQELLPIWREKILPALVKGGPAPFSSASTLAEEIAALEEPAEFLALMRIWWRDLIVYRETGDPAPLLIARTEELAGFLRERDAAELDREFLLIGETEQALEGNVLKQLALERLFFNLMTPQ